MFKLSYTKSKQMQRLSFTRSKQMHRLKYSKSKLKQLQLLRERQKPWRINLYFLSRILKKSSEM